MSKTESRFKSKLESLKKLQHSASTNSAVEKARAFFRSLELKHLGGGSSNSSEHSSGSLSNRRTTTNKKKKSDTNSSVTPTIIPQTSSMSSSSSSSIMDDSHQTISTTTTNHSSFLNSNCIATARIIRVINPKDVIVHRAMESNQDDQSLSSSYLTMPNVLSSKTNSMPKNYQTYSVPSVKSRDMKTCYDTRPMSSSSLFNPNITYSSSHRYYSNLTNGNLSNHPMSSSLYNYRPLVCRQMESPTTIMSSSFHEQSDRLTDSIIRPLPPSTSTSSISTWTQSVRRLNTEYASTINALQQAKESLQQICSEPTDTISKYASFVARGINDLSNNNETKKSIGVTFCLTAPISQESLSISSSTSSQISKNSISQCKTPPLTAFSKPKLVRPLELDTFIPSINSLPKLEVVSPPPDIEINEKIDSIANIIKKFNNLNHSPSISKSPIIIENHNDHVNNHPISPQLNKESTINPPKILDKKSNTSHSLPRVHFKSSVTTYELEEIPYESPPPPLSSSSSSSSLASEDSTSSTSTTEENPTNERYDNQLTEETTYTVETFYHQDSIINKPSSPNNQQVVVIRENTTEEQFNSARNKSKEDNKVPQQILTESKLSMNQTNIPPRSTPLFTYLKQTTPTPTLEKQENLHNKNYHSVESSSLHIRNKFISSNVYPEEDDETINDVVTVNPYTQSPPSHRLTSISSTSSSTDTASSTATVLLTTNTTPIRPTSSITNGNSNTNKNNQHQSISQLPRRTLTNNSRLKQPTEKVPSPSSKLKPPSSTNIKPIKSMIANSTSTTATTTTTTTTSPMRKPTGIMNQSSTMTSNSVNKTTQQQSSSSSILTAGKKSQQQLVNGNNMTESQNSTDPPISLGKNRVRSMVNQLNAAVSTSPSTNATTVPTKRIPIATTSTINTRRTGQTETTTTTNRTSITSSSRPSLQRALTMNNQSPVTSPPSTPPTMNNTSNNSSTYKRKAPLIRSTSNVKEGLLRWCQAQVAGYPNVSVTNLSSSWSDGLAFCALVHHFFPDAFDFKSLSSTNREENFELAFHTAEERADVPRLLDVSDMLIMGNTPDYKCIFTYLNSFLAKVKDLHPTSNGV